MYRFTYVAILLQTCSAWLNSPFRPPKKLSATSKNPAPESWKEEAERLRQEVAEFEQRRAATKQEIQNQQQKEAAEKQQLRERYSATVPILKPDGRVEEERVDFPPYYKDGSSFVTVCEASLPLGLILGESEDFVGAVTVDEIADDSNAARAGLQIGDLVRAFTACRMEMEQPTWQLIAGGIGRPKMFRFMYSSDNKVFEEVMDAIGSNRMDPEGRPVLLVLEKRENK